MSVPRGGTFVPAGPFGGDFTSTGPSIGGGDMGGLGAMIRLC